MRLFKHSFFRSAIVPVLAGCISIFVGTAVSADNSDILAGYGLSTEEVEDFLDNYDGPLNFLDLYFPAIPSPFQVRIRFDDKYEELTTSDTKGWRVKRGNSYVWDDEKVYAYFEKLKEKYDTPNGIIHFTTHDGEELVFDSLNCGWHMHLPFTVQRFEEAIDDGQTIYDPAWNSGLIYSSKSDVGPKYVEVDISDQMVYLFEYEQLIMDSPCVTGTPDGFCNTLTGVFQVNYKSSPSILKGEDAGGNGYEQPVDFWIAFNGGQGLHDANWRSSFGGDIYQYNGSHGCVNLPPEFAGRLYREVYPMYPVIVHD